jgi:NADH:ubiquinone oxidoreductase subunit E
VSTKILTGSKKKALQGIYDKYRNKPGSTIPILQDLQGVYGYLPEEAVNWIADRMNLPRSSFFGIATFYSQFYLEPRGKNVFTVCCGTACHVKGSDKILTNLNRELDLAEGEVTTVDMNFTVEKVNCVGACGIAPVIIINDKVHGTAASNKIILQTKKIKKEMAKDEQ